MVRGAEVERGAGRGHGAEMACSRAPTFREKAAS
jgi:hypothetical protein